MAGLAEVDSIIDALRCANVVHASIAERNASMPADDRIEFRMDVKVVVQDNDIFGDGVNVAALLDSSAPPGAAPAIR